MKFENNKEILLALIPKITKDRGKPSTSEECTALLEIYGLRDIDAKNDYLYDDLFDMGEDVFELIDNFKYPQKIVDLEPNPNKIKRITYHYIEGLAFAMPMIVQILLTLILGYALWSSLDYDLEIATVIAAGTFLALVITGPSAQAIGRKGLYYVKLNEFALAGTAIKLLYFLGIISLFIVGIILYLIYLFFGIFNEYYYLVMIVFYILLSIFFLNAAIYYMHEEHGKLLMHVILGMIIVYFFHSVFKISLPNAQFYTLLIVDIEMSLVVFLKMRKLIKKSDSPEGYVLPKASIMFYSLVPFYSYGLFYFLFLVLDRIIAWSVTDDVKPYFIWFNVPYELGLDWALMGLVLLMGFTEAGIYEIMYIMNGIIGKYKYNESSKFSRRMQQFMNKFLIIYFICSILVMLFVYFAIQKQFFFWDIPQLEVFNNSITKFVFWFAAASYVFLVGSLLNILFLFAMSRQKLPAKYIFYSTIINLICGTLLSRMISFEYAVFGLFFGAVSLYFFTFNYTRKALKRLDYFYYSAF